MDKRKLATKRRKWERTGKPEDEAAYLLEMIKYEAATLLERVKKGDLEHEKLQLAAHLGHKPACIALEVKEFLADTPLGYIHSLEPWGKPIFIVAAIASSRLILPYWEKHFPLKKGPRLAIECAINWCKNPCDELELPACEAAQNLMGSSMLGHHLTRVEEAQFRACLDSAASTAASVVMTTAISMSQVATAITSAREVLTRVEPTTYLHMIVQEALISLALTGNSPALESLVEEAT